MRTVESYDGVTLRKFKNDAAQMSTTSVEDAPISKKVVEALRDAEFDGDQTTPADYLELDVPEPTFSDPDAKTIEVAYAVLPKSDYKAGPYNQDTWYENLANNPEQ